MLRSIWRIVRNPEDAEDTLQEALTVIWKRLDRVRNHPNPRALIMKICTNCAYDTVRRTRRHASRMETSREPEDLAGDGSLVRDLLIQREQEREIVNAIGRLPRKQAVCVLMRVVEEMPYEEIAQALGCSATTARIHVSRGRARLQGRLAHLLNGQAKESC